MVKKQEVSRGTLYYREAKGDLIRLMPGFFVNADELPTEEKMIQWITARQPAATMNLISALSHHGITTQIPAYLSVALPRGVRMPRVYDYPVKAWATKREWTEIGVDEYRGEFGPYRVTSPERTLVDCFRYRHKIGLDVFMEALTMALQQKKLDTWKLDDIARRLSASRLITPYLKMALASW